MHKQLKILFLFFLMPGVMLSEENQNQGDLEWKNGVIRFESRDRRFTTSFDIRLFINGAVFFEDKNEFSNGTDLQQGRFAVNTQLWDLWKIKWDLDIAGGKVTPKDMFIIYSGFKHSQVKIGHFKMPLGLEELTSSRYTTFIERAYPMNAFKTDRRVGLEYSVWGKRYNFKTALFGQKFNSSSDNINDETGGGYGIRFVTEPVKKDNILVLAGFSGIRENPDDDSDEVKFHSIPETKIGNIRLLQTPDIPEVDNLTKIGFEGFLRYKSLAFQGEYIHTKVHRFGGFYDLKFCGGYVYVSWFLTGEKRNWDISQGLFTTLIPDCNRLGAWELIFRFSHLNLSDAHGGIWGGMANNYTAGLNWYPNPNMRFMLNYTLVDNSQNATGNGLAGNDDFRILQTMIAVFF